MSETEKEEKISEYSRNAKLRISKGEFTDAEYFFKKITKLEPDNWHAWQGRGLCFKRMEMWERASYCFESVTQLVPQNPKGWYNLGFCQIQLDNIEEALYSLNKSTKIDPSYAIPQIMKAWIFYKHENKLQAEKLVNHVKETYPEFIKKFRKKNPENEPLDYQLAIKLLFDMSSL